MNKKRITAVLYLHRQQKMIDIDIPLDITANELIVALIQGFHLNMDMQDISRCYLKTEKPIALLRGNKTLAEYGLRDGVEIHYTE